MKTFSCNQHAKGDQNKKYALNETSINIIGKILKFLTELWQYRLSSFKTGDTKVI